MSSPAPVSAPDDPFRGVTVHVVYDISYSDWELKDMLPNRIRTEVGLAAQTHYMSLENAEEVMARIPPTDFVFNYCDGSVDGEFVLAERLFKRFPLFIGAGPAFLRATEKKSVMDALLRAAGLPVLDTVAVNKDTVDLPETRDSLSKLGLPLFVKVNAGYDSLGLTVESICQSVDGAIARCRSVIAEHGPVVVQRFLSGREFTVPTAFRRAYRPTEKLLPPENFYFSWMKDERWRTLDEHEPDNIQAPLMELAATAYNACSGDSYGRVDIRQDANTKELFVLEVNSVCSIAVNSFFDLGIEPCGLNFGAFFRGMMREAKDRADQQAKPRS